VEENQSRLISYVKSLSRKVRDDIQFIKDNVQELKDLSRFVSPEKNVPQGMIVDIREMYKEIQNRFKEIHAIQQMMQGKYRQYYQYYGRDPVREKEILELTFVVKTTYSRFEENMKLIIEKGRAKDREEAERRSQKARIIQWFVSRENQIALLRNIRTIRELDYGLASGKEGAEKRVTEGVRSLTLFLIRGEAPVLDAVQSQLNLREHDLMERHDERELRGVLTHLREVDPSEIEALIRRLLEKFGFSNLKSLLLHVRPHEDLELRGTELISKALEEMKEGEVRTLLA
jgi:hypothetical protein